MTEFTSVGRSYSIDRYGVVHQTDAKPFKYDSDYISTYSKPQYQSGAIALSCLRLGWVLGAYSACFRDLPYSLLDVGYGSGAFMREAVKTVPVVLGTEISKADPPEGCGRVEEMLGRYDVVTFWDSLEHFADIDFVESLDVSMVAISLPLCHEAGGAWFDAWKHRKPDEHLHHFSREALQEWMKSIGWKAVADGGHEDIIRIPPDRWQNILSMAFVRY